MIFYYICSNKYLITMILKKEHVNYAFIVQNNSSQIMLQILIYVLYRRQKIYILILVIVTLLYLLLILSVIV